MKKTIWFVMGFAGLLLLGGGFFFWGSSDTVRSLVFKRVTPAQVANAMQDDHFYASYRQSTLIVRGQVSAVAKVKGVNRVTFRTPTPYTTWCSLAPTATVPKPGDTVTFLSEGGLALRQ